MPGRKLVAGADIAIDTVAVQFGSLDLIRRIALQLSFVQKSHHHVIVEIAATLDTPACSADRVIGVHDAVFFAIVDIHD
jgi:hypothetical protein